jgi:hypothetical protein
VIYDLVGSILFNGFIILFVFLTVHEPKNPFLTVKAGWGWEEMGDLSIQMCYQDSEKTREEESLAYL